MQDNGPGIPLELQEKIMEPFFLLLALKAQALVLRLYKWFVELTKDNLNCIQNRMMVHVLPCQFHYQQPQQRA